MVRMMAETSFSDQHSRPTLEQFLTAARTEFAFLVSDYGFEERPPEPTPYVEPFFVRFVGDDLEVAVQGLSYGRMADTTIRDRHGRKLRPMMLHPDFVPYTNPIPRRGGQLNQISQDAQWLREYGRALLAGDLGVMGEALIRYETARDAYESAQAERRRLGVAIQEAVAAFRLGQWALVVELLDPHEAALSPRMARKLATARQHTATSA